MDIIDNDMDDVTYIIPPSNLRFNNGTNLRFNNGMLEQLVKIKVYQDGEHINDKFEWQRVPSITTPIKT